MTYILWLWKLKTSIPIKGRYMHFCMEHCLYRSFRDTSTAPEKNAALMKSPGCSVTPLVNCTWLFSPSPTLPKVGTLPDHQWLEDHTKRNGGWTTPIDVFSSQVPLSVNDVISKISSIRTLGICTMQKRITIVRGNDTCIYNLHLNPWKLRWQLKATIWRWISYWNMVIFRCHVSLLQSRSIEVGIFFSKFSQEFAKKTSPPTNWT